LQLQFMRAGTKLYLPVEVEGALFSLGDAHAAQGDGEVCGTAIETAARVTLSFALHRSFQLDDPALDVAGALEPGVQENGEQIRHGKPHSRVYGMP
jgi:acetamidase/formamidase